MLRVRAALPKMGQATELGDSWGGGRKREEIKMHPSRFHGGGPAEGEAAGRKAVQVRAEGAVEMAPGKAMAVLSCQSGLHSGLAAETLQGKEGMEMSLHPQSCRTH